MPVDARDFYRLDEDDLAALAEMSNLIDEMYSFWEATSTDQCRKGSEGGLSLTFPDTDQRRKWADEDDGIQVELNASVIVGAVDLGDHVDTNTNPTRWVRWASIPDALAGIRKGHAEWMAIDWAKDGLFS